MNTQIRIGNYTVLNSIGSGTFGKVKMAIHSFTGHKVALKILNRRRIVNLNMVARLKREVQYLQMLGNPHVIKLYEVITTPTDIILVLEYAGGELFNYIVEKGRMSEGEARKLFQQIITAVEHCHHRRIVHRDLKPENILLDSAKNVKIGDFGLSNYLQDGDFLKTSCGSPNYAAPEVISGKLYAGPEIDIWSCGVILYVMLCGQLPFDDDHIPTLFKKINSGIFRVPSFLSNSVKELLSGMLTVDPLKRITIAEIRKHTWFSKDLPSYMSPGAESTEFSPYLKFNAGVVEELSKKMKFCRETIHIALKEPDNNQIQVAYRLMIDNQLVEKDYLTTNNTLIASLRDTHISISAEPSSIQIISNSIPSQSNTSTNKEENESKKPRSSRSRWHYGIRSRSDPVEIMQEIYSALSRTLLKWKCMDTYRIRCLHSSPRGETIKLDIQLYKIEPGNYLVDFKRVDRVSSDRIKPIASIFTFFDACTKIITELAVQN